jgi:hypothetical protein
MGLELDCHIARHAVGRCLAGAEHDAHGIGDTHIAGQRDDKTRSLRHHGLGSVPRRHEVGTHADIDHLPVRNRLFPERAGLRELRRDRDGVVDQNVEAALFSLHLREQRGDLLVVGVIDGDCDSLAAASLGLSGRLENRAGQRMDAGRHCSPRNVYRRALLCEDKGDSLSYTATRPRYDGHFPR